MNQTQAILRGQLKKMIGLHKQIEKSRKSILGCAGKISAQYAAYCLALLDRAEFSLYYVEGDDINAYDLQSAMGRACGFIERAELHFQYSVHQAGS